MVFPENDYPGTIIIASDRWSEVTLCAIDSVRSCESVSGVNVDRSR